MPATTGRLVKQLTGRRDTPPVEVITGSAIEFLKLSWFIGVAAVVLAWLEPQVPNRDLGLVAALVEPLGLVAAIAALVGVPLKVARVGRNPLNRFIGVGWAIRTTVASIGVTILFAFLAPLVELLATVRPMPPDAFAQAVILPPLVLLLGAWLFGFTPVFQPPLIGVVLGGILGIPAGVVLGVGVGMGALLGAGIGICLYTALFHLNARLVDRGAIVGGFFGGLMAITVTSDPNVSVLWVAVGSGLCAGFTFESPYIPPQTRRRGLRTIGADAASGLSHYSLSVPGYDATDAELRDTVAPTSQNVLVFSLRYPLKPSAWVLLKGGFMLFVSTILALSLPFVAGYLLRVTAAAANGYESPPTFRVRDWFGLIFEGLVVSIALVINVVLAITGGLLVTAVSDSVLLGMLLVGGYVSVLPAVYLAYAIDGRVRSPFNPLLIGHILSSSAYHTHLLAALVLTVVSVILLAVSAIGIVTIFPVLFYVLMAHAALWGRAWTELSKDQKDQ